jgi:hypothetical protein
MSSINCSETEGEIINYNYPGSIAEYNMNFASTVDVIVDEKNELFNAVSIYVPMSLANANIVDFDPAWVTAEKPAVITCTLDSYKKYMKGKLLDQWQDVFRQDTNFDVIVYLIVFLDDASTNGMWDIDDASIKFAPITEAFNKLYFISFVKTLFDGSYDGKPVTLPGNPGTAATAQIKITNSGTDARTVNPGAYLFNDGVKDWTITLANPLTLPADAEQSMRITAATVGAGAALSPGVVTPAGISPALPADIAVEVLSVQQGANPSAGTTEEPSKFFDYALALSYMCKQDIKLSYFINMVKISYADGKPNPSDPCWIRYKTSAQEKEAMLSVKDGDRARYYWGALFLMGCVQNTWTLAHSEPVNIVPLIFAAWFIERNASGQYVGNKLSLLRLRGIRIKPCGFPSWLNSEVNANDRDGIEVYQAKNVGFLRTISDNTPQESCVDSARSINGTPVGAQMISKWVDYTCAQQCAKFITDDGTVTDPALTNEDAYTKIQNIVIGNLLLFTPMKRISSIKMKFPSFAVAKTGPRELRAARSWLANYSDDLDKVTVTGGVII